MVNMFEMLANKLASLDKKTLNARAGTSLRVHLILYCDFMTHYNAAVIMIRILILFWAEF